MIRIACFLAAFLGFNLSAATPRLDRVSPLGGQAGAVVEVELHGELLDGTTGVFFDSSDLKWIDTLEVKAGTVRGMVRIAPDAALGPHLIRVLGKKGPTNTRLFNVTQFPGVMEVEPNNTPATAQPISLTAQVVYGYMQGRADVDVFSFTARAGERWLFDLQSIERGGFLECSLTLYDEAGREIGFNEDQDEYLETPRLEFNFVRNGRYTLKVDQYRGPQGVACDQNCAYMLQISQLPVITSASPLGARVGSKLRLRLDGSALGDVKQIYITPVRSAEYYRLTFPFSIPLRFEEASAGSAQQRIAGKILQAESDHLSAEFQIPAEAKTGLWRIWAGGTNGVTDGMNLEISSQSEVGEGSSIGAEWMKSERIINGALGKSGEEDSYRIEMKEGVPFHAWSLAAQLGLPSIDTVLELFDEKGKRLAEHDDLMTGQGTVIGNPDSSLYFTPNFSGGARLVVRDRTGRGGVGFSYRLHLKSESPSFQLLTEPEEVTIAAGGDAHLEALLIREPGFEQAVEVWIEGLPPGAASTTAQFRADQVFGPSGDGDNINIPAVTMKIHMPESVIPGEYPIRVRGKVANSEAIVEGFTTLWIGPTGKRNDTRRPLPQILLHVTR